MPSFCSCTVMGHLTREPDYRHTPNGNAICELSVAFNRRGKSGQEEVSYLEVVVWGKNADNCRQYLSKGSCVHVTGYLKQERWQDNNGTNRSKIRLISENILFMPSGKGGEAAPRSTSTVSPEYGPPVREQSAGVEMQQGRPRFYGDTGAVSAAQDIDEDVPF